MELVSFNNVKFFTVTINSKTWTRAKEVCKALEYRRKTGNIVRDHCSRENYAQMYQLSSVTVTVTPMKWPLDSQKTDLYISEEGMYELAFTSNQEKAKKFKKYCCNVLFPQIRKQAIKTKKQPTEIWYVGLYK